MKNLKLALVFSLGLTVASLAAPQVRAEVPPFGSAAPVYSRSYTARHLRYHPNQRVKSIVVANELFDSVQTPSPFMRAYQDASLVGEITLTDGMRLAVRWRCRANSDSYGGLLECIPNDEALWKAMSFSLVSVRVESYDRYSSVLPKEELIQFPGTVAFHPIDVAGNVSGAIVLLGLDQTGPEGDTAFWLRLSPQP